MALLLANILEHSLSIKLQQVPNSHNNNYGSTHIFQNLVLIWVYGWDQVENQYSRLWKTKNVEPLNLFVCLFVFHFSAEIS